MAGTCLVDNSLSGSSPINIGDILTKGQTVAVFVKLMKILHNLSQESAAMLVK